VQLFCNGADPSDCKQGALGDCWLLSALSILAAGGLESERGRSAEEIGAQGAERVRSVIVYHHRPQRGRAAAAAAEYYLVRFFRPDLAQWEYVAVTDAFPCVISNGKKVPAFAHSDEPETWVMVLEKAYAAFTRQRSRAYAALNSGLIHDGLVSFTGGAAEEIALPGGAASGAAQHLSEQALWVRLNQYAREGFLMGAGSPPGDDSKVVRGIVQGHGYAILELRELRNPLVGAREPVLRLIKLRNPWGRNPWSDKAARDSFPLDWLPHSPLWDQPGAGKIKSRLQYYPERVLAACDGESAAAARAVSSLSQQAPAAAAAEPVDEGVFWLSFRDFVEHFATVFVCRLLSDWESTTVQQGWRVPAKGSSEYYTAGGVVVGTTGNLNPQFVLNITQPCRCFIALTQQRASTTAGLLYMAMVVLDGDQPLVTPLSPDAMKARLVCKSGAPVNEQQVSLELSVDRPRKLLLVPFASEQGKTGDFNVRIYTRAVEGSAAAAKSRAKRWGGGAAAGAAANGQWAPEQLVGGVAVGALGELRLDEGCYGGNHFRSAQSLCVELAEKEGRDLSKGTAASRTSCVEVTQVFPPPLL